MAIIILDVNGFWNKKITLKDREVAEYEAGLLKIKGKKFSIKFRGIVLAESAEMFNYAGELVCTARVEKAKDGFWPFKKEYFVVNINNKTLVSDSFVIPPKEEIVLREVAAEGEDNKKGIEVSLKLFSYPLVGTISFNNKNISENETLQAGFTLYALTAERYVN